MGHVQAASVGIDVIVEKILALVFSDPPVALLR